MAEFIQIQANGQSYQLAPATPLSDFIGERGLRPAQVVTERNGQALTPRQARECILQDGDRLELVRIVAGG